MPLLHVQRSCYLKLWNPTCFCSLLIKLLRNAMLNVGTNALQSLANAYSNKRCRLACYSWHITRLCKLSAQVRTEREAGEHLRCLTHSLVCLLLCQMALQYNRIAFHNIDWHRCVTCKGACWHWHTTINMSTSSQTDCHKANQGMTHGPNASCNCAHHMDMQAPALPMGFDASQGAETATQPYGACQRKLYTCRDQAAVPLRGNNT